MKLIDICKILQYQMRMKQKASSINEILAALPAAQEAVRKEIQARIDAGEIIASMDSAELQQRSRVLLKGLHSPQHQKKSAA